MGANLASQVTVGGTNATNIRGTITAGEIGWQWLGTPPQGFAQSFFSYCVDLSSYLTTPQQVTVQSSVGFTNGVTNGGAKAAWLFTQYADGIHAGGNAMNAAALQLAIWEAMYDTTNDLTRGAFNTIGTSSQITTKANEYLTSLYSSSWTSVAVILNASASTGGGQDQITQVSEPSTLLLLGLAFFGIATLARRTA